MIKIGILNEGFSLAWKWNDLAWLYGLITGCIVIFMGWKTWLKKIPREQKLDKKAHFLPKICFCPNDRIEIWISF